MRYPGGKQRLAKYILPLIPKNIKGIYVEPFLGSGAIFFALNPQKALLSDVNQDLVDVYIGVKRSPQRVWEIYSRFPRDKQSYYNIRNLEIKNDDLSYRAARWLYLNRNCFNGVWRQNSKGKFNSGYGGSDRIPGLTKKDIEDASNRLEKAKIMCSDFEPIIDNSEEDDFIFCDPPYKPHSKELIQSLYFGSFHFNEYKRLARSLERASNRGTRWLLTISSHQDILNLFNKNRVIKMSNGTGQKLGILDKSPGEAIILNYY